MQDKSHSKINKIVMSVTHILTVILSLSCVFLIQPVSADTPPVPGKKTDTLKTLKTEISIEKQRKAALQSDLREAAEKLGKIKAELVKIGQAVKNNERLLTTIEHKIQDLGKQRDTLETKLKQDYSNVADLLLALQRISRIPPEALIIKPGVPLETAQSALIMKTILPAINERALHLSRDLDELSTVETKLSKNKRAAIQTKLALDNKYTQIKALSEKRQDYYKRVNQDYTQTVATLDRLASEAASLEELVQKIEEENRRARAKAASDIPLPRKPETNILTGYTDRPIKSGDPQLPVSGVILTDFGEKDNIGAASQGVRIDAPPGGLVVAPLKGTVRFAGTFKNYGQLVILEHSGGYHSLIGGLHAINVSVGERLGAGEPLGKLAIPSSMKDRVTVYYELRHKGKPVNPSRKLSKYKS